MLQYLLNRGTDDRNQLAATTSLERKPEPLSITIWVIAFCSVIAVSSCYGLVLLGWPGAWLGGFAGFFLLALLSRMKRFLKRLNSVDPQ